MQKYNKYKKGAIRYTFRKYCLMCILMYVCLTLLPSHLFRLINVRPQLECMVSFNFWQLYTELFPIEPIVLLYRPENYLNILFSIKLITNYPLSNHQKISSIQQTNKYCSNNYFIIKLAHNCPKQWSLK